MEIARCIIHLMVVRFTVHTPMDTAPMTNGIVLWNSMMRDANDDESVMVVMECNGMEMEGNRIYYV